MSRLIHAERHYTHRIGWLRAAVLGANDGIVSTAALVVGVAAAESTRSAILVAGVAGLVAGAMSMAAGEYVSVSSQADTERADLARETRELAESPEAELRELQNIYISRGLDADLALRVAEQLSAGDRLAAHARDELGITEAQAAKPIQAALASAATFSVGAALPLVIAAARADPTDHRPGHDRVTDQPRGTRRIGCRRRRRRSLARRHSSHVLERTRDGANGARRPNVRRDGVTVAKQ